MRSNNSKLTVILGEDVGGRVVSYDIGKMPHLLIAGTTGSGKSIFIHNLLFSLLFKATPQEVKLILIDPKRVELILYDGIPHLLTPVVTDMDKAPSVFRWAGEEMERRYKLFETARVKNIDTYNEKSGIVIECQEERYQGKNREKALKVLKSKLFQVEQEKQQMEDKKLKGEYKTPGWGNQIRNYVLHPYKLVKDLRTNLEITNPEGVLNGELDELIEAELKM